MKHQYIMGVLRSFLGKLGLPETGRFFLPATQADYNDLMINHGPDHIVWMQREAAEKNPAVLQLLPYMVIRDRKGRIFTYQRTKGIGEDRLLGKKSIGVGGHIDLTGHISYLVSQAKDTEHVWSYTANVIMQGLQTELNEELSGMQIFSKAIVRPIGFLLDDVQMVPDTEKGKLSVGRVHLGVVFEALVPDVEALKIKEDELIQCEPLDIYRTGVDYTEYENWSAMLLGYYRVQRNSGFINSADTATWDADVEANRGRFYVYSANPFVAGHNLASTEGRYDMAQFEALEKTVHETLGVPSSVPHGVMDQTPWKKM